MSESSGSQNTHQDSEIEIADQTCFMRDNVNMADSVVKPDNDVNQANCVLVTAENNFEHSNIVLTTDNDVKQANCVPVTTETDLEHSNIVPTAQCQGNLKENVDALHESETNLSIDNRQSLIHDEINVAHKLDTDKVSDNGCHTPTLSSPYVKVNEEPNHLKQIHDNLKGDLVGKHSDIQVVESSELSEKNDSGSKFVIDSDEMLLEKRVISDVIQSENDDPIVTVIKKTETSGVPEVTFIDQSRSALQCEESNTLTRDHVGHDASNVDSEGQQLEFQDSRHSAQTPTSRESFSIDQDMTFPSDHSYILNVDCVPKLLCESKNEFEFGEQGLQNFLRGCKWSPDGTCLVTNSNDNKLRLFSLTDQQNMDMRPSIVMKEGSQIYDFAWLPQGLDSQSPRVACSCSGIPVHLWNTAKGKVEASYKAFDQYDEITAAYSLCFSKDGGKLLTGYDKAIRIFDVDCPQRPCRLIKTYDSSGKTGQRGIISCFAMSPDDSGLFAAGSYSRQIGLYDTRSHKIVSLLEGQFGGITHLMYSPDGTKLYSGGRKDSEILCWDVRNTSKILYLLIRDVQTHQRMYFDFSKSGRWITAGNHDGSVFFWDTSIPPEEEKGEVFLKPQAVFQAHLDCVNGVSFNPVYDVVATASGQRHFQNFMTADSDSSGPEDMDTQDTVQDSRDFSLRIWTIDVMSQL